MQVEIGQHEVEAVGGKGQGLVIGHHAIFMMGGEGEGGIARHIQAVGIARQGIGQCGPACTQFQNAVKITANIGEAFGHPMGRFLKQKIGIGIEGGCRPRPALAQQTAVEWQVRITHLAGRAGCGWSLVIHLRHYSGGFAIRNRGKGLSYTDQAAVGYRLLTGLRQQVMRAVDLLLPPRCAGCGCDIEAQGLLCGDCWNDLRILEPPWCICCGQPFAYEQANAGERCGSCLNEPPIYDHARAAFAYDGVARQLVLGLKHADKLYFAPLLAGWLQRLVRGLPDLDPGGQVLVVPVPLHWRRLLLRRHNQSAELARYLVREVGSSHGTDLPELVFEPQLVTRNRATPPQGSDQAPSRHVNVRGAFTVTNPARVKDAHVLLVDDVITTGATVNEIAKLLKRAGARRVDVLTVTRVVRD